MPRYIVALRNPRNPNEKRYVFWSTVVDQPVTFGLSKEEFIRQNDLDRPEYFDRLKRAEVRGTSCVEHGSWLDTIRDNRAGPGGSCLSPLELWAAFAYPPPKGTSEL